MNLINSQGRLLFYLGENTMDRTFSRRLRLFTVLPLVLLTFAAAGCMGPVLTAMYLFGAADVKAQYDGLKKQKVVVVCNRSDLDYSNNANAEKHLARQIGLHLKANIKSIKLIDQQKVERWMDENQWEESIEIGKALEADKVVEVDLQQFSILLGQTLYQGKANYVLRVIDCETGETAYDVTPNPVCWPPNTPVPTQEKPERQFRKQFVGILSQQIARHFYSYDHRTHFAEDSMAFGQ